MRQKNILQCVKLLIQDLGIEGRPDSFDEALSAQDADWNTALGKAGFDLAERQSDWSELVEFSGHAILPLHNGNAVLLLGIVNAEGGAPCPD